MFLYDIVNKLNLNVLECTNWNMEFQSINFHSDIIPKNFETLYFCLEETLDDTEYFFLFLNHKPAGTYQHYILVESEYSSIQLFSLIQDVFDSHKKMTDDFSLLTETVTNIQSLDSIIKTSSKIINNPIVVSTNTYDIITLSENNIELHDKLWDKIKNEGKLDGEQMEEIEAKELTKKVKDDLDPVYLEAPASRYQTITGKISYNNKTVGYISIFLVNDDNHERLIIFLKHLIAFIEKHFIEKFVSAQKYTHEKHYLYQVMSQKEVTNNTREIIFKPQKHFRLLYISYKDNKYIYNSEFYLESIISKDIIGTIYNEQLILLITYDNDCSKLIGEIISKFNNHKFTYIVSCEYDDILDSPKVYPLLNGGYTYDSQVIYIDETIQILHNPKDKIYNNVYEQLMKSRMGEDKIQTLAAYIENNMNVSECAKALYTHRNTVIKRLDKISTTYHLDMDDYISLMNFYLYYCAKRNLK